MKLPKDRLDRLLRDLPPERASDGFTGRLMTRIAQGPQRGRERESHRLVWAALAAGAGALALFAVLGQGPERAPVSQRDLRSEIAEMRRQHELLTEELTDLRTRTESASPVLYLGSIDQVDYVVDLSPLLLAQSDRARATPASTRNIQQLERKLP